MYRDETRPAPPPARLFLALWPASQVLDSLVSAADAWQWPDRAKRTRRERLHVTLHFIGNVPQARLDELRAHLRVPFEPFAFELDHAEVWRGGIAVLAATHVPPALASLHERLAQALRELALPVEERKFRPHVTLARNAYGARPPAIVPSIRWNADAGYALVRTLGGGRGYESLAGFA